MKIFQYTDPAFPGPENDTRWIAARTEAEADAAAAARGWKQCGGEIFGEVWTREHSSDLYSAGVDLVVEPFVNRNRVVVYVSGGVVQGASADQPVDFILIDQDNIDAGDPDPRDADSTILALTDDPSKAVF
jgi:hypothetical protein